MPHAKGFVLAHQKVSINVELNGKISGHTELTITPTAGDLKVVWLHARELTITAATLRLPNGATIPLEFNYLPPAPPVLTQPDNIHTYPELKRSVWRATSEGEEGELGIALPVGSVVKVQQLPDAGAGAGAGAGRTPATPKDDARREDEWEQVVVQVEYDVASPGEGIVVVRPDEANPSRFPHVFTSAASDIAARTWVPCSDYARDRCTWDLELIVPRTLYAGAVRRPAAVEDEADFALDGDEDDGDDEAWPISVVCSGELVEQVQHPVRSDLVIWHYSQASPVSVHHIAWAVGPFSVQEVQGAPTVNPQREVLDEDDGDDEGDQPKDDGPKLHALCLPGREAEMAYSIGVIRQAMDYYTTAFGSYPFSTYTVAFVDSLASGSPTFHAAALTLMSSDVLHPPSVIDQAYETRHLLAHALAIQWAGVSLIPKTPGDVWLTTGIALHMTSLFLRALWGNNEYRFRLKKDMIRCVNEDVQREPISVPARHTQPEPEQLQFIALKAPLVLHILDKHLRKSGTSLGLDKVLPKLFLDALAGDLGTGANYNTVHTSGFMRTCRKACGGSAESLKVFFDQWVYGSGCPTFFVSAIFNRKKMAVELKVEQKCLAHNWAASAPWEETGHLRPIPIFEGQMTIRIHEADGTPYEHVLIVQDLYKRHEVPFNTKYKRIRRNTKRYQARQAAATAAASGDAEAQEDVAMMDVGFSLALWEDEAERDKWRVADWTEEDDSVMSQATYEWIRIDADLEWICNVNFEQQDFMWLSQLQRDRDIVAQLEAVHALSRQPSAIVSGNLTRTVLVTNYFFRVRMEAALALISCATEKQDFIGLFHLLKLFQTRYCFEPDVDTQDPFAFRCIPKTNNFEDLTEYFLKKTIVKAISMVRDKDGQTPPVVHQFLVDLLAYNDNLGNPYSDTYYITSVMSALGHSFVAVASKEAGQLTEELYEEAANNEYLQPAIDEVERYMSTDRLVPSYHNAITIAGIEFKVKLTLACLMPEDRGKFFVYTRDGNYPPVRIAAFDALLLLNPLLDVLPLVRYFFGVLRNDSSLLVQRRLAQSLLQSLPVLAAIHDLAAPEMLFEEAGGTKRGRDALDPLDPVMRSLRKRPGRSNNFRQALLQTLVHRNIDPEVRLCLLKLCESTVKPQPEPLMKVRIPARQTIVGEPAPTPGPTLPKLKLTSSHGAETAPLPKITLLSRPSASPMPAAVEPEPEFFPEQYDQPQQAFDQVESLPYEPPAPAPKKLKLKAVEGWRTRGMEPSDYTVCKNVHGKVFKSKHAPMFRYAVDPVQSGAPRYFEIVTNPMDLSLLLQNLNRGEYADRFAFRDDFKRIISNAILYNQSGPVVDEAHAIDKAFDKQWERTESTLRRINGPAADAQAYAAPAAVAPAPAPLPAYYAQPEPEPDIEEEPYEFAVPALPTPSTSKGVSFKLSASSHEYGFPPAPAPAPVYAPAPAPTLVEAPAYIPPPPEPEPVKPAGGFKLKFGGSSIASTSAVPARSASPAAVAQPKIKKIKIHKVEKVPVYETSSYTESPPPPASVGSSAHDDDDYGAPSHAVKPKKSKDKDRERKREKGKHREKDLVAVHATSGIDPVIPNLYDDSPAPPGRPAELELAQLPEPTKWFKADAPVDLKKAKSVVSKMKSMREAFFFLEPVVAEGLISDYYTHITHPMDLQTMTKKLEPGKTYSYETYGEVFDDFKQIVINCKIFNPPNTEPVWYVEVLDRAWRAEWEKASKMSYTTKRSLGSFLKNLMAEGAAYPFLTSINEIIDQVPQYFDYIKKGDERDLGTMKKDLEADKYNSIDEVDDDITLMVNNCMTYNAPGTPVYISAVETRRLATQMLAKLRADPGKGHKRAGEKSAGGALKKTKY